MIRRIAAINFVAFLMIPFAAKASLITGVLNITGTVNLSAGGIAFGSGHQFSINSPASAQQGSFMSLAGTTGTIADITNPPGSLNVPDFITFTVAPNISITLTLLDPGIDGTAGCTATPAAGGQVCTPAQSPFDFQNTSANTATATFNISGSEVDSLTGTSIAVDGVFTMPLNESYQQLLTTLASSGTFTSSFSGSIATESSAPAQPSVPEPSTWASMAIGAAGICLLRSIRLAGRAA